jgi:UvrD-like helicase C-terminal domain
VFPKEGALGYVANGEIGLVVGPVNHGDEKPWFPSQLQAVFATQPKHSYYFSPSLFGDEVENQLELAYAITVHKAQGSEFDLVFLVVPEQCPTLSRELLYTALTRQKKRIVLLVQGEVWSFKRFGAVEWSESTRRFTYLFDAPQPVQIVPQASAADSKTPVKMPWQDGRFIHRTRSGIAVESKSEVIVANELDNAGIRFIYGQTVEAFGGQCCKFVVEAKVCVDDR